jgi:hypothetical protein
MTCTAFLSEHAAWSHQDSDIATLNRWLLDPSPVDNLARVIESGASWVTDAKKIVGNIVATDENKYRPYGPSYRSML